MCLCVCVKFLHEGNNGSPEMFIALRRWVGRKVYHRGRPSNYKKLQCDFLVKGNTEDYTKLETLKCLCQVCMQLPYVSLPPLFRMNDYRPDPIVVFAFAFFFLMRNKH